MKTLALTATLLATLLEIPAMACPKIIQNMKSDFLPPGSPSLCEVADRYTGIVNKLKLQGVSNPDRISDVLAPRFIMMTDWLSKREAKSFDPWLVYEPAPQTWASWEKGRELMERQAAKNLRRNEIATIDMKWVHKLHETALKSLLGTAGQFRRGPIIGNAPVFDWGLTPDDVASVESPDYMVTPDGFKRITWHPQHCVGNAATAADVAAAHALPITINDFDLDPQGNKKQCGYFQYETAAADVENALITWMNEVNSSVRTWGSDNPATDPILVAARTQRFYISVHPFNDGNGRTSRFDMDLLLESIGLPAPVLDDMNKDTTSTEAQWAAMVGKGIMNHIAILETCALDMTKPGCNEVHQ